MAERGPTGEEVLQVVREHGRQPTYVIKNWLRSRGNAWSTDQVRYRLRALEKEGKVRLAPSNYAVMLCWEIT